MTNQALIRTETDILTNKSGGAVAQGDIVIVDTANAEAFTTTTTGAYTAGRIGVVLEPNGIASNAAGKVAFTGRVPVINLSGTGSIGDLVKAHTVAKQGVRHAAPQVSGDFAQVYGTSATPKATLFGSVQLSSSGTGDVVGPSSAINNNLAAFDGTTGKLIKDAGVALSAFAPWLVDIIPQISDPSATTGTWALTGFPSETITYPFVLTNSGVSTIGAVGLYNSSAAQNDAISWDIVLSAGTWNCTISARKSSNTGIFTLNQDGSSMGTVDSYAASAAFAKLPITGWTVSTTGKHTMQLKMATKNASSSGYLGELFGISFRRTA